MSGTVGMDLAKTTGVAWVGETGPRRPWRTWTIDLNPRGRIRGEHYFAFQKQVDDMLRVHRPDLVVFEEVDWVGPGLQALRVNSILCGIVIVRCEAFATPYVGVSVGTVKKHAGHGHASKEQMAAFAREKLFGTLLEGEMPEELTADEVDALWVAAWGIECARAA